MTTKLAVLISGSGRSLQNFIDLIAAKKLDAKIEVVVSSSDEAGGNDRARKAGIPVVVVERKRWPSAELFSEKVTKAIDAHAIDLVLMAGFLHLYTFPPKYEGKVLNIHPSLLPKHGGKGMYGHHVHEAVLKAGDKETGCTVHVADLRYDRGPIVLQKRVPVVPGDTVDSLAARVFAAECEAYPEAVRQVAAGRPAR